ncbi:beta-galactosidase trimerization domain-containing protein [Arundinibacter roseus]|uniref:Beta-galactosidase trimerisation domain-containing protein n=1 Tax=Arundinibacter roseus TaxID=2070510 RepID=A0A4R4KD29_9BACT|nr:beta-galactosidase trimerization domain-containing protein [Arundinibacter roseus]TDB65787.1 hypothetical protein EZE20_08445 [Arundinibacter roseus]
MQRRSFISLSLCTAAGLWATTPFSGASLPFKPPLRLAVLTSENTLTDTYQGVVELLTGNKIPFEFISSHQELEPYQLLILPDHVCIHDAFISRFEAFLARGGTVLASFQAGLTADFSRFFSPAFGLHAPKLATYSPGLIRIKSGLINRHISDHEVVMIERGMQVKTAGADVLGQSLSPLTGEPDGFPAVTLCNRVMYFAHPVFAEYHKFKTPWSKQLILNALNLLTEKNHPKILTIPV